MSKKYLFICLMVLLFIQGCIDKPQTQAEKAGWNQIEYEKYSKFYTSIMLPQQNYAEGCRQRWINNGSSCGSRPETKLDSVEDVMIELSPDKNEFENLWYRTFLNMKRGLEELEKADEITDCFGALLTMSWNFIEKGQSDNEERRACSQINRLDSSAKKYFNESETYRQKIEDMKPD